MEKKKADNVMKFMDHYIAATGDTRSLTAAEFMELVAKNIRGSDLDASKVIILTYLDSSEQPEIEIFTHKSLPIETSGILIETLKLY